MPYPPGPRPDYHPGDYGKSAGAPSEWGQLPQPSDYPMPVWEAPPLPPPKSTSGALVAMLLGLVVIVAAAGVGAVVFLRDDGTARGAAPTTTVTTRPHPSARLSYTEYAGNWDFRFERVELHAEWVDGRDHSGCGDIEAAGKLTGLGCVYAAEMVYRAEGGALMLTQFVLGMSGPDRAAAAVDRIRAADLNLRGGSYRQDYTTREGKTGREKKFVVVTLATATGAVDAKYLHYRHADIIGALMFR